MDDLSKLIFLAVGFCLLSGFLIIGFSFIWVRRGDKIRKERTSAKREFIKNERKRQLDRTRADRNSWLGGKITVADYNRATQAAVDLAEIKYPSKRSQSKRPHAFRDYNIGRDTGDLEDRIYELEQERDELQQKLDDASWLLDDGDDDFWD